MRIRTLSALLCATLMIPALTISADAAPKKKRVKPVAVMPHHAVGIPRAYRNEPARMIEIAPGRWISTWGCYTDEGNGRFGSCDMREGPN